MEFILIEKKRKLSSIAKLDYVLSILYQHYPEPLILSDIEKTLRVDYKLAGWNRGELKRILDTLIENKTVNVLRTIGKSKVIKLSNYGHQKCKFYLLKRTGLQSKEEKLLRERKEKFGL